MRLVFMLSICGACLPLAGCALVHDTATSVALGIARPVEECLEKLENKKAAKAAWGQVNVEGQYSEHYGKGFQYGFAEFLFRGGNGQPPVVAPPCYRSICYQTEEGHQAVQDWFAGYRHGADEAKKSGLRQWIVAPSALTGLAGETLVPPPIPESPGGPPIETRKGRRTPSLAKLPPARFPTGGPRRATTVPEPDLPMPKLAAPTALPPAVSVSSRQPLPSFGGPSAVAASAGDANTTVAK